MLRVRCFETQTALISAISGRWSRPWSATPPVGVTPPGCWSRPRSLVTPPVAGHAPQKGRTSLTTQSPHRPRTRYIQLAASNSLRPTRCVVFPSPAWRNARSDYNTAAPLPGLAVLDFQLTIVYRGAPYVHSLLCIEKRNGPIYVHKNVHMVSLPSGATFAGPANDSEAIALFGCSLRCTNGPIYVHTLTCVNPLGGLTPSF